MRKGFTLIELLIVMVILGILTTLVAGNFSSSQQKSRDARRKNDLVQIGKSLELYFNDTGQYPTANSGRIVGCGPVLTPIACEWDEEFSNSNDTIYMSRLPGDPRTPNQDYYYDSDTDGTFYQIYARLENENDNDIPQSGGSNQVYTGTSCDGVDSCNYAISSPNIGPADNGHSLIVE